MAGDYQDKTVYVVGGSQGIGRACAEAFADRGARLVLFARGAEALEETRLAVEARGSRASTFVLDATDGESVRGVMETAVSQAGPPDILLNCVGGARPRHFEAIDDRQFMETLRWNLFSCWNTVSALAPRMKGRGGVIVNTASLSGLVGVFGYTDYSAAKFGVVGFSEALRSELKPHGVRVCVLCPADTKTPGFEAEEVGKPAETRAVSASGSLLSSGAVAEALLAGIERDRFLIVPGREARWIARVRRFAPRFVDWVMDRAVARARKTPADTANE